MSAKTDWTLWDEIAENLTELSTRDNVVYKVCATKASLESKIDWIFDNAKEPDTSLSNIPTSLYEDAHGGEFGNLWIKIPIVDYIVQLVHHNIKRKRGRFWNNINLFMPK